MSQPSDSASEQAKVDRQGSAARPTTRTDLDTDVPNEGFGIEPDEPDEELRDALRREPGR